jgi:hypothetical protein
MLRNDGADDVYPTSEDTHLLMDALANDKATFDDRGGPGCLCLEIGYACKFSVTHSCVISNCISP